MLFHSVGLIALILFILVYRQQSIKMQGARPKVQSDSASKVQQQKLQISPVLVVDDKRKPTESVDTLIKQQEFPLLMQARSWTKSVPVRVCKNGVYTCFITEVQESIQ
jgi:hypothetical protein